MLVLIGIGLVAGLVTAISPCVLPVLPIVLAGGAGGGRRRPYAIVAGLLATFTISVLAAAALLRALGLPQDLLRNISIAMLFVLAGTLVVPRLGDLLERPFRFLTRRRAGDVGGGFLLGATLGFVYVPCAGPVLGTVSAVAATGRVGVRTVVLTLAYAVGASIPLLAIAKGSHRALRRSAARLRPLLGLLIAATAVLILFHMPERLQTSLGDYTGALQRHTEASAYARGKLERVDARKQAKKTGLRRAPEFRGISHWLNGGPQTRRTLRGKVVLVDFWTYSCINCLRTLSHLEAWDRAYRKDGLVIVGVHTPEFAFEHELSNVRDAVRRLGVRYSVALDNDFATWDAYKNQYWPAEYLIDRTGVIRHEHFGEGEYADTEATIRTLLAEHADVRLGRMTNVSGSVPHDEMTPETYLGWERLDGSRFGGLQVIPNKEASYTFPRLLPLHGLAYAGRWRVEKERIVPGAGARLRLHYLARTVHLVLGGRGHVRILVNGRPFGGVAVTGDRLYTLVRQPLDTDGVLELRFTRGVQAYAFTFG